MWHWLANSSLNSNKYIQLSKVVHSIIYSSTLSLEVRIYSTWSRIAEPQIHYGRNHLEPTGICSLLPTRERLLVLLLRVETKEQKQSQLSAALLWLTVQEMRIADERVVICDFPSHDFTQTISAFSVRTRPNLPTVVLERVYTFTELVNITFSTAKYGF